MLKSMNRPMPPVEAAATAHDLDEPSCIFAALVDSLSSSERYTLEARGGELFITPVRRRAETVPQIEKAAA